MNADKHGYVNVLSVQISVDLCPINICWTRMNADDTDL